MTKEAWINDNKNIKLWVIDNDSLALSTEAREAVSLVIRETKPQNYFCCFKQESRNKKFLSYVLGICAKNNINYAYVNGDHTYVNGENYLQFSSGRRIQVLSQHEDVFRGRNGYILTDDFITQSMFKQAMYSILLGSKIRILANKFIDKFSEYSKYENMFSIHKEVQQQTN